jgi:hypothetical protein
VIWHGGRERHQEQEAGNQRIGGELGPLGAMSSRAESFYGMLAPSETGTASPAVPAYCAPILALTHKNAAHKNESCGLNQPPSHTIHLIW